MKALVLKENKNSLVGSGTFYLWIPEAHIYISDYDFSPKSQQEAPAKYLVKKIDVPFEYVAQLYFLVEKNAFEPSKVADAAMEAWRETGILTG